MTYEEAGRWIGKHTRQTDGDWKNEDEETLKKIMKDIIDSKAGEQYKDGMKEAVEHDEAVKEYQTHVQSFIDDENERYQNDIFDEIDTAKIKEDLDDIGIDEEYMDGTLDEIRSAIETKREELESDVLDELESLYISEIESATTLRDLDRLGWDETMEDSDQRTRIARLWRDKREEIQESIERETGVFPGGQE